MRRKVSGALSLLLTVTVLGTSVPSVVLAEDFGQQSEIQWDSEEKEATGVSEEQELPKENESESDEPQESDDFTADISEEPESDPTQDQAPEPTQIPDQDIQQEVHAEDISMDEEKLTTAEGEETENLEITESSEGQIEDAEELVSAGESSAAMGSL